MGYFFRKIKELNEYSEKFTLYLIYILLFFMGLGVGVDPAILKNAGNLGATALLIAIFGIMGSVIFAFLFSKKIGNEK